MLLSKLVSAVLLLALTRPSAAGNTLPSGKHLYARNSTGLTDAVTWDAHSLSIFGKRTFILSAEFHPWRQPNPNLWADVFQKIKANGCAHITFVL